MFSDVSVIKGQVKHKTHLMTVLVTVEFDILADFERNVTFLLMFKILFILQIQHVYMTDF